MNKNYDGTFTLTDFSSVDQGNLSELLNHVHDILKEKTQSYKNQDRRNQQVLDDFGLELPFDDYEIVPVDEIVSNLVSNYRTTKCIRNLKQAQTILDNTIHDNEENNLYLQRELTNCKEECYQSERTFDNKTDKFSKLREKLDNVHKTPTNSATIKKIIEDLGELSSKFKKIEDMSAEMDTINQDLKQYKNLPPNILEAKKKLQLLEEGYNKSANELQNALKH